jgi:hypothetical protein
MQSGPQRKSAGSAPKCAKNARSSRLSQTNRTAENGLLGRECSRCPGFSLEGRQDEYSQGGQKGSAVSSTHGLLLVMPQSDSQGRFYEVLRFVHEQIRIDGNEFGLALVSMISTCAAHLLVHLRTVSLHILRQCKLLCLVSRNEAMERIVALATITPHDREESFE